MLRDLINKGDKRSIMAKKNVLASVAIKGADTLVYLLLVPLTLGYLNAYEYGIWLTLSSILSWINSFDIGLGSGLRNKLAEAIAEDDKEKARGYVSTTFFMLLLLTSIIFVFFSIVINYVDWYSFLNVTHEAVGNLKEVIIASFMFFCLSFLFKFVGNVYQALQLPAVNTLLVLGAHVFSLVAIFVLRQTVPGSLFWVAVVYSASMPMVYLLCYPLTFHKLYPFLAPKFRCFKKEYLKDLFSLSVMFFVLQIMGLVLFSLSNIIISNLFGPDQVTPYNIAYRYFSVILIFSNFILAPLWSATTDAYARKDYSWISRCLSKIRIFIFAMSFVIASMILCSGFVYKIWVGDEVVIPFSMSLLMGIYIYIILYSITYSSILNGLGKLYLQMLNIIIVAIVFYPICYFLSGIMGVNGILAGMCIVNLTGAVLNTIQINRILDNTATGVWAK